MPDGKESKPAIELVDPQTDLAKKFEFYIKVVIGILVVAFITMIIMVGTLVMDSFHFTSATYKEYSAKIEIQNTLLETSKILIENDQKKQKIIENRLEQISASLDELKKMERK